MHLKQGDPKPLISSSCLTLIGHRFCPYVERVRLMLAYHHIEYDYITIALNSKPDWFLELNPTGKVPVLLTTDGKVIPESIVDMRFVDSLRGKEASLFTRCDEADFDRVDHCISQLAVPLYHAAYTNEHNPSLLETINRACLDLCQIIKGPFVVGPDISAADLLLLPHLNRLEPALAVLKNQEPCQVKDLTTDDPQGNQWPKLIEYMQAMRKQAFVASIRHPACLLARYAATVRSGHSNPDL